MGRRLRREEVMTIEVLHERGLSNRAIARQLGVHEHAVRYRLARQVAPVSAVMQFSSPEGIETSPPP